MSKYQFTAEELTSRWEDVREIENLIGRLSFLQMMKKTGEIRETLWCKKAVKPSLAFNSGAYSGYEAIEELCAAYDELTKLRTELIQKAYPEKLAGKSIEDIYGAGSLTAYNITTPLVELAGDGQSAKGLWYIMGSDVDVDACGPRADHTWGRLAADFVKEDGAWKLWHLIYAEDINCPTGGSWGRVNPARAEKPEFSAIGEFRLPEPNVPGLIHEAFHKGRELAAFPALPVAYSSFVDTFSYGY